MKEDNNKSFPCVSVIMGSINVMRGALEDLLYLEHLDNGTVKKRKILTKNPISFH